MVVCMAEKMSNVYEINLNKQETVNEFHNTSDTYVRPIYILKNHFIYLK